MKQHGKNRKWRCLICLVCTAFYSFANEVPISITDFGLSPDTRQNATPYIMAALEHCKNVPGAVLSFPEGRYDCWPHELHTRSYYESNTTDINPKQLVFLIDRMQDLTIEGNGALFMMHDRLQPFTIDQSSHITVRNLTVDWEIPLTAQGEVIATTPQTIDIRIDKEEYPYVIEGDQLYFIGDTWKGNVWEWVEIQPEPYMIAPRSDDEPLGKGWKNFTFSALEDEFVRIIYTQGFTRLPKIGNLLILRHNERDHAGVFIQESAHIQFANICFHHTAGLGVLAQFSRDLTFRDFRIIPNEEKGRMFSSHDDGMQLVGCSGQVVIDRCRFKGTMDDPINIHNSYAKIEEILSPTRLKCAFMHPQSEGLKWARSGEKIGFVNNQSLLTYGETTVKRFIPLSVKTFEIELSSPVPAALIPGWALDNITCNPNIHITNSLIESGRARGILVSTSGKVLIEKNIFESSGSAILIAGDANYWYESGAVSDVTITNNTFRYPCLSSLYQFTEGVISICPHIPQPDPQKTYHRNIRITGNHFDLFDAPFLYANSVDGLVFEENKLTRNYTLEPYHPRKYGVSLDGCRQVWIRNNQVAEDLVNKEIHLRHMQSTEVTLSPGETFTILQE